jgi:crotonobetaine/carnitine-CoA ligase
LRRRGENISSYEVERPILEHPKMAACAVVGVPAETGGEDEVLAVVVPRAGKTLEPGEIWSWCDERLPAFARPRYVKVTDALPTTPSGKIQKSLLRADRTTRAIDRLA